jgi:hypothetical protein
VPEISNDDPTFTDPDGAELRKLRRYRLVLSGSVVVYLGLAVIVLYLLPDYSFIAWIFMAFAVHSSLMLFRGEE